MTDRMRRNLFLVGVGLLLVALGAVLGQSDPGHVGGVVVGFPGLLLLGGGLVGIGVEVFRGD